MDPETAEQLAVCIVCGAQIDADGSARCVECLDKDWAERLAQKAAERAAATR